MKTCPLCQAEYEDDLNFCLNDGATLKDSKDFNPEQTLAYSSEPTWEYKNPQTAEAQKQTNPQNQPIFNQPASFKNGKQPNLFLVGGIILGIVLFVSAGIVGGVMYLRSRIPPDVTYPTPTRTPSSTTPYRPPTPDTSEKLKIEVIGKVKGSFGSEYLKCLITNKSGKIIERPGVSIFCLS